MSIGDWWCVRTGLQGWLYKLTNDSRVYASYYLRMEGEAIKAYFVEESSESTETHSRWARRERMAMANDSTNCMRSSAMSDIFIVLSTFLAHFWLLVIYKSDPHWLFAKWSLFELPSHACPNLFTYEIFCLAHSNFCLIRAVSFLSRV